MKSREEHLAWFTVLVVSLCFIAAHAQGYSGQGNLTQSSQRPESTPTSRDSKATEGAPTQSSATLPADILNHELKTIDDGVLKLADYSGKIIVVNLFASWCAPCRQNLWDLIKLKADYKPRDIEVIGVVAHENDPNIDYLRTFAQQQEINFSVVWDKGDFGESLVKAVNGRTLLPQTLVIDKGGRIRSHFQGFSSENTPKFLRKTLDQITKEEEPNKTSLSP